MNKKALKTALAPSAEDVSLLDLHREHPKAQGGIYEKKNVAILSPVDHMKHHGNYREREEKLDKLKSMMDERSQMLKNKNSMNNRLLASQRETDNLDEKTIEFLSNTVQEYDKHLKRFERQIGKHIDSMSDEYPIVNAMLDIKGVGTIAVAQIMRYVDIEKCRYASSLWAYVGFDKPSHKRYTKNEAGGGNKTLRSALYVLADSFIKQRNVYRDIYDNEKQKLSVSEKITQSRNTQGKLIECKWKDTKPGHRHGAAIRKMLKHYLADLWKVWRTLEGLDTPMLYPEAKLGHKGIVLPEERGWNY